MRNIYLLTKKVSNKFEKHLKIREYNLYYHNIDIHIVQKEKSLIGLGNFSDIRNFDLNEEEILAKIYSGGNFKDMLFQSKFLIGRFLLFLIDEDDSIKVINDAVSSIPAHYTVDSSYPIISSHPYLIAKLDNLSLSEYSYDIYKSRNEEQHPLPYDITLYDGVKILLPNHYYDSTLRKSIRYYPDLEYNSKFEGMEYSDAISKTNKIIGSYVDKNYSNKEVLIPLTAGIDSRLILSFFKNYKDNIFTYTFYNNSLSENQDIIVAQKIANEFGIKHKTIKRKELSETIVSAANEIIPFDLNRRIISNGYSLYLEGLNTQEFLPGDIVPIVKSNFGKALPESFATADYLKVKNHNFNKQTKLEVNKWISNTDIDGLNYPVSKFDLFFWENRLGRWQLKNTMNYDLYANCSLIFNCRYLLEMWISFDRKTRIRLSLHDNLIKKNWPELMNIPLNPDKSLIKKLSDNDYVYYLASYINYYKNYIKNLR